MLGFIIASVSLVGLVVVTHHHRHHGVGGRRRLWRLLRRLDTTPGQEKVIRSALTDLKDAAREFGSKTRESRPALADILRAERVDDDAIESWLLERGRIFRCAPPTGGERREAGSRGAR